MDTARYTNLKQKELFDRSFTRRDAIKTFRVSSDDSKFIQSLADIYTDGCVDLWLRLAATHFRPGPLKLEQVVCE